MVLCVRTYANLSPLFTLLGGVTYSLMQSDRNTFCKTTQMARIYNYILVFLLLIEKRVIHTCLKILYTCIMLKYKL